MKINFDTIGVGDLMTCESCIGYVIKIPTQDSYTKLYKITFFDFYQNCFVRKITSSYSPDTLEEFFKRRTNFKVFHVKQA